MSEEPQEELKDNAFIQEFMTTYLYGMYTIKGGRLSPADSIRYMLSFAEMAEKANETGKSMMKWLDPGK